MRYRTTLCGPHKAQCHRTFFLNLCLCGALHICADRTILCGPALSCRNLLFCTIPSSTRFGLLLYSFHSSSGLKHLDFVIPVIIQHYIRIDHEISLKPHKILVREGLKSAKCRLINNLPSDPLFVNMYHTGPPFLCLLFSIDDSVTSFLELKGHYDYHSDPQNRPIMFPTTYNFGLGFVKQKLKLLGSCNGIICLCYGKMHDKDHSVYISNLF